LGRFGHSASGCQAVSSEVDEGVRVASGARPAVRPAKTRSGEPPAWNFTAFPQAVSILLHERQITLGQLSRLADVSEEQLTFIVEGGEGAPLGVIELVATTLGVQPRDFLDYRIATLIESLARDPDRTNELFLESLSEIERRNIDPSAFDNRDLRAVVKSVLADEELTQGELAESLDMTRGELALVIGGKHPLDSETPAAIAAFCGVEPEHLLAYRLAILGDWLTTHPHETDSLLGERVRRLAALDQRRAS
jgi:transcriptional regulator with XRE-family HTH domain